MKWNWLKIWVKIKHSEFLSVSLTTQNQTYMRLCMTELYIGLTQGKSKSIVINDITKRYAHSINSHAAGLIFHFQLPLFTNRTAHHHQFIFHTHNSRYVLLLLLHCCIPLNMYRNITRKHYLRYMLWTMS